MIELRLTGVDELLERLNRLQPDNLVQAGIMDSIGAEVESQVRRRIQNEKRAPDGAEWPDWSPAYARTRHGGHSLLQSSGGLLDSIETVVSGEQAEVGSPLVYAPVHQHGGRRRRTRDDRGRFQGFGGGGTPAREFLGLSHENEREIGGVIVEHIAGVLQ
jgi:phage virion morphogenesis protein